MEFISVLSMTNPSHGRESLNVHFTFVLPLPAPHRALLSWVFLLPLPQVWTVLVLLCPS